MYIDSNYSFLYLWCNLTFHFRQEFFIHKLRYIYINNVFSFSSQAASGNYSQKNKPNSLILAFTCEPLI